MCTVLKQKNEQPSNKPAANHPIKNLTVTHLLVKTSIN